MKLHTRRDFIKTAAGAAFIPSFIGHAAGREGKGCSLVAITLDLEMARNFPRWEDTHWDYEKGNLNQETKDYALEAAARVKSHGGRIHFFLVGRVLEQENVDWLKKLVEEGHPIGNHTYDHVHLKAAKPEDTQFRFQRAPWLVAGQSTKQVLEKNIRLCTDAMQSRLGINPEGFRTPGGFHNGLADTLQLQEMLLSLGFKWISSKYPAHPNTRPGETPDSGVIQGIAKAQQDAQPFAYPGGLIEVPMSPISDVGAFRNGRWKIEHFLDAIEQGVLWAIDHGACFDFLAHPSVLYPMDPEFRVIEKICEMVKRSGAKAKLATLNELAERAKIGN